MFEFEVDAVSPLYSRCVCFSYRAIEMLPFVSWLLGTIVDLLFKFLELFYFVKLFGFLFII